MTEKSLENIDNCQEWLEAVKPQEGQFRQAVCEVVPDIWPAYAERRDWREAKILERMIEPDRVVSFRVTWKDDDGRPQINRAHRVQFNNVLGPYKGGLRFTDGLTIDTLKFLGFEQTFKNALTHLPIGGAKGGSDFNPKGRSDSEVMAFCQAMMAELHRHIGPNRDVPAGDIGVGEREIGYLFGQYRRLVNEFTGTLTGKGQVFGGSALRTEATGYGLVYFVENMLNARDKELDGLTVCISGAGNVALYAAQMAMQRGMKVLSVSDSGGTAYFADGMTQDQWDEVQELKVEKRGHLSDFDSGQVKYLDGTKPWQIACDVALPCATQNEMSKDDAQSLVQNGVTLIAEGANMPLEPDAISLIRDKGILFGPAKAANAGGVAVSGLEQTQNAERRNWSRDRVNEELTQLMREIHDRCRDAAPEENGVINYQAGANRAAFQRIAEAMYMNGYV